MEVRRQSLQPKLEYHSEIAMKIVVITGSPRKNGNSFAMTEAFIREAESLGHTVQRFDAALLQIGGCRACQT
ncbi:MAG: NAD(P)H-dependent oxidoreductase, partial [Alistipes sp.]|nr:NAD(P)H-dependent oxidoreductase [Alistipes sp.]